MMIIKLTSVLSWYLYIKQELIKKNKKRIKTVPLKGVD